MLNLATKGKQQVLDLWVVEKAVVELRSVQLFTYSMIIISDLHLFCLSMMPKSPLF
jgi:hypothetical protein